MKGMGPIPAVFSPDGSHQLSIGGRLAEELVAEAGGTPLFVYDNNIVGLQIARFRAAMPDGVDLHYAVKANPYPPLLAFIARYVDGFDVASAGELDRLDEAGVGDVPLSFAGPGKSDAELFRAIELGATINLESESEAGRALRLAGELGIRPKLAVRVNPPFAIRGAGMKMGGAASQFGLDHDRAADLVRELVAAGADWRGLHIYAGSQVLDLDALVEAQRATVALAAEIAEAAGAEPPKINLGGGFGIPYFAGDTELDVEALGRALNEILCNAPQVLALTCFSIELGRWMVGEAGVYLTRVIERKESRGKTFLVTDGGLHHMLAASGNFGQLLRRNYPVAVAGRFGAAAEEDVTVTGCLCTPLDLIADDVALPRADAGDLIAVFCAGAYGLSASPQAFLSQTAAREVLV
ncbi:pyridoxal-dependent decarboxylase, exosortase A system-associated [Sphingomonas sp.]|uniref:pyridoxal-dependent decarboxylase, exosortase A system-associated n=1 Tax=Sphingomonas sp. TaxID=28214 RepID=UPI00286D7735|nr:pyridoxal-dependent decarboxylase, exosortase A system-associated [Sphingomonas sp.]